MRSDHKLGLRSIVLFFFTLNLAKYLLVMPSYLAQDVGNSAWMVLIIKGLAALGLFAAAAALYRPYVELGFGEVTRRSAGKVLGGAVNILLAGLIITQGGFLFRTLAEALRTIEADSASLEFMAIFILIPVLVCATRGLNANVNMSIMAGPLTVVSVAAIALAIIPNFRFTNIFPLLGEGVEEIAISSFGRYGGYFEMITLFIFSGYTGSYRIFKRGGLIGISVVALISSAFTLMYCAAIPAPAFKGFFFPLYQLTRMIRSGAFVHRLEPLVVFVWAGVVLCAMTTMVIEASHLLKCSTGARDAGGFVPLMVIILFLTGALAQSELASYNAYRTVLNISNYVYPVVIFVILLIARGRRIETT